MERIMPIDLQHPDLKRGLRGYDRKAVDEILERAAQALSSAIDEAATLKQQLAQANEQVERYRAEEAVMREALILAQKAADETRSAAHREADIIREGARQQATESIQDLRRQADDMKWEVERLRLERMRFTDEFRSLLERYQRDIDFVPPSLTVAEAK